MRKNLLLALLAVALAAATVRAQAPPEEPEETAATPAQDENLKQLLEKELGPDQYDSGGRRDPFISLQKPVTSTGPQQRPRGVEGFLIQELALKGIVRTQDGFVAMLLGPDNKSYFLRVGQRLYDGAITNIDMTSVTFHQDVTDPLATVRTREVKKSLYPSEEARQ
jgi:Tfp pilus assembly protein PilP